MEENTTVTSVNTSESEEENTRLALIREIYLDLLSRTNNNKDRHLFDSKNDILAKVNYSSFFL
jgi:hypothetical protein